jgi:hypothetical protein
MSYAAHIFRAMIASPSGLKDERAAVREAIYSWNSDHSQEMGMVILPSMWETDAHPSFGTDAQTVVNRTIVDTCDLLIGFFGETLGTQTPRAASGTVEEIQRVHEAGKPVLLYFGNRQVQATSIDPAQLQALHGFKQYCRDHSLYGEFTGPVDLQRSVEKHLLREMRSIRFPPEDEPPTLPSVFLLEGNQLTLRTKFERWDHFATEPDKRTCIQKNPLVLLSAQRLTNLMDLLPLMEVIARQQRPLLLLAPAIEGEALETLAVNQLRGTFSCCPVVTRGDRDAMLALRDFSGATIIGELGTRLDGVTLNDLGTVAKVIVERHQTRLWKVA